MGFSLIEVMVALMILSFGIVASLGMIQASRLGMTSGQQRTYATGLAMAKMEEKLSVPNQELLTGPFSGEEMIDGFTRTWTIQSGTPTAGLAIVHVTVKWKDGRGFPHRLRLAAVRAQGVNL